MAAKWIVTLIGEQVESDIASAVADFRRALDDLGHRINTIRIQTDAGEHTVVTNASAINTPAPPPPAVDATGPVPSQTPVQSSTEQQQAPAQPVPSIPDAPAQVSSTADEAVTEEAPVHDAASDPTVQPQKSSN